MRGASEGEGRARRSPHQDWRQEVEAKNRRAVVAMPLVAGSILGFPRAGMAALPMDDDELQLIRTMTAFRKLGDFPSQSALKEADAQLTTRIERMTQRGGPAMAERLAAGTSMRGLVRYRSGKTKEAFADIAESFKMLDKMTASQKEMSEVPAQVWAIRGQIKASMGDFKEALSDYDKSVALLEDLGPVEDSDLLVLRGKVRRKLGLYREAASDFGDAAVILKRIGARPLAVLEAERGGIVLAGAGAEAEEEAVQRLSTVISSTIGLLSDDIPLLQQVVLADCDARIAMAAIRWHQGQPDLAESYWRDANARLNKLVEEAVKGKLTIGFPNGQTYNSSRYINDEAWLTEDRLWPGVLVGYLKTFIEQRTGQEPPQDYLLDLSIGRMPGEGSTLVERYRNRAPLF